MKNTFTYTCLPSSRMFRKSHSNK